MLSNGGDSTILNSTSHLWLEKRGHEEELLPGSLCFGPEITHIPLPAPQPDLETGPAHLQGAGKWSWGNSKRQMDIQQAIKTVLQAKSLFNHSAFSLPLFIIKLSKMSCPLTCSISRILSWCPCQRGYQLLQYMETFVQSANDLASKCSALSSVSIPSDVPAVLAPPITPSA